MLFWYFLLVVAFVWLIFATIVDIKKREVPNWLNYSLVAIGLGGRLIYSFVVADFSYILFGILGFGVFLVFANFMYYTKQWGGGDSKLLMGLGAMFGSYNLEIFYASYKLPFLVTLLVNIFIAGTVYGIIYAIVLGIKNNDKILKKIKYMNFIQLKIFSMFVLALIIASLFIFDGATRTLAVGLLIVLLIVFIVLYFLKVVEDVVLYKNIDTKRLVEGDWLAGDVVVKSKVICHARNIGLTKKDIEILKNYKVKKVLVREGIPFVPGFLIGFLISIIFGDIILWFI